MSAKTIIFHAPQGWGKSTHADTLMKQYKCASVVDDYEPDAPLTPGALHLTSSLPSVQPQHWRKADAIVTTSTESAMATHNYQPVVLVGGNRLGRSRYRHRPEKDPYRRDPDQPGAALDDDKAASMSSNTVILCAPQAWGKTRNAEKLRRQYGCDSIVDDWVPGQPLMEGAIHLTNEPISEQMLGKKNVPNVKIIFHGTVAAEKQAPSGKRQQTTFKVGCTMQPDQYLAFLAGSIIETVGAHSSVASLARLREARAKLDRLISTLEQLEREQKTPTADDTDLRNIQAQQRRDMTGDPAADCSRMLEAWSGIIPNLIPALQALAKAKTP